MPTTPAEYMTIAEARQAHGHSRDWWHKQLREGALTRYRIVGDKRVYLSRPAVAALFAPKPAPAQVPRARTRTRKPRQHDDGEAGGEHE